MKKHMHPLLEQRDQAAIQNKLKAAMVERGIDALLLTRPENILYATGYPSRVAYASGVPAGGAGAAVLTADGDAHLIISNLEAEAAKGQTPDSVTVVDYPSWLLIDDGSEESRREKSAHLNPFIAVGKGLEIIQADTSDAVVGIETASIVVPLWQFLNDNLGDCSIVDSVEAISQARMIKTPWEIDVLRRAVQLTERAMEEVMYEVMPGMSAAEIENRLLVHGRTSDVADALTNAAFLLSFGPHYGISGLLRDYRVAKGDIVKFDGGNVLFGYHSDIARTFAVGSEIGGVEERVYDALYTGYLRGIELLKPGVPLAEMYREVRKAVEGTGVIPCYARGHIGHGVGVSPIIEESPIICRDADEVFEPGMVMSFETSYFATGAAQVNGGFNLEDTFIITDDGHERLTHVPDHLIVM